MMGSINQEITKQYGQSSLYEDILKRLEAQGILLNELTRAHLSSVDEFHIRGVEVSIELADEANLRNKRVLDVGCGLGGPCRLLAEKYNCETYGLDLSFDYINTAKSLSRLVPGKNGTNFLVGDALNLPYEDGFFDVVWTQHVQMNIEDKSRFYSEINRVLAKKGTFVYYDIFEQYPLAINYPVPWADSSDISFLQTVENMESILKNLGFIKQKAKDQSDKALEFLERVMDSKKLTDMNTLGLNLLLGDESEVKFRNVLTALQNGIIELNSGVYKKQ